MDIKEELKIINAGSNADANEVARNVHNQVELWMRKFYILQAINFANQVERLADAGYFKDNNIGFMEVSNVGSMHFYNINNTYINDFTMRSGGLEVYNQLRDITSHFDSYSNDYGSTNWDKKIDFQKNIKSQILDVVLSKELKKIVEYNELAVELKENNDISPKRPKL